MTGFSEQCVEKYCELANVDINTLKPTWTPYLDDNKVTPDMQTTKGELQAVAARIVLKFLYSARFYRYDILYCVNWLARMVTKWTAECDARLLQLAAYVKTTSNYVGEATIGDPPDKCHVGLFVDANYAGDAKDSKSTSGGLIVIYGPHTFAPVTAICKRQGFVSHSSTESEIISLEHGMRTEGLPMLALWDTVLHVLALPLLLLVLPAVHLERATLYYFVILMFI